MWGSGRAAGALLGALPGAALQRRLSSGGPPWRLLFFGTDQFAVESLRALTCSRSSGAGLVRSVEVVTLPGDVPVRRFARQNRLTVHSWPPELARGRFDVGVVVSFGCLLQESLIQQFPHGILNVHPSLLPRWRGPAPIFHTILQGDAVTGVTIIQILPHKFDVGPILNQELHSVPDGCSADELGASLASKGAQLLLDTLKTLPERIAAKREQGQDGATFAPKISAAMSWVVWEEQTCEQIARLHRAIGWRIPLRTLWMGQTVKLLEFAGQRPLSGWRWNIQRWRAPVTPHVKTPRQGSSSQDPPTPAFERNRPPGNPTKHPDRSTRDRRRGPPHPRAEGNPRETEVPRCDVNKPRPGTPTDGVKERTSSREQGPDSAPPRPGHPPAPM